MALIKFEGKPIEKLIEVLAKGAGKLYEPNHMRRLADSKAYEFKVLEKAKIESKIENFQIEQELFDKIEQRIVHREAIRQSNLDKITFDAAQELNEATETSDGLPTNDWIRAFFDYAENVCEEDMQQIWSKVLAGEIKKPKSFSLRTLQILKNLSTEEATNFEALASLSLEDSFFFISERRTSHFALRPPTDDAFEDFYGLKFTELLNLIDEGLITSQSDLSLSYSGNIHGVGETQIRYGEIIYSLKASIDDPTIIIPVYLFTTAGKEIASLIVKNAPQQIDDLIRLALLPEKLTLTKYDSIEAYHAKEKNK